MEEAQAISLQFRTRREHHVTILKHIDKTAAKGGSMTSLLRAWVRGRF